MPWFALACAVVAPLAACRASTIDARAAAELSDARATAERSIDYARCSDGARFGANCGLVMRIAASDDFRERFRAKVCAAKTQDACDEAYRRMIDAEMARRYFAASWDDVTRSCDLHPGRCDDGVELEKLLLVSHNTHVQATYAEEEQRIEAARRRAHEAAAATTMELLTLLGGRSVCHSYPSAFGGWSTVCSR